MEKKNSKKNKKNRLLLLLLLLVLTVIMLSTATYAWFTSNRTVSVETIDVNVTAVNGLQISSDATNWKAKLLKNDLKTGYGTAADNTQDNNMMPDTLGAVSTAGTLENGRLKMFMGSVNANESDGLYYLTASRETDDIKCFGDEGCAGAKHYIAFDIFLKVDTDSTVLLTGNSGVKSTTPTNDNGIKNAARVAFVNEGYVAPGSAPATAWALKGGTSALIWEPNFDVHTPSAIQNASSNYGLTGVTETGSAKLNYKGVNAPITSGIALNDTSSSSLFSTVTTVETAANSSTDHDNITLSLTAGINKIRVYMWVEGQDVDAENNATGQHMTFDVEFALAN